jgi:hypothetical protein
LLGFVHWLSWLEPTVFDPGVYRCVPAKITIMAHSGSIVRTYRGLVDVWIGKIDMCHIAARDPRHAAVVDATA